MTRLEQMRVDALMSVDKLAGEASVSSKAIRRLERGGNAHMLTLAKLSTYFEVPASSLLLEVVPERDAA